MDADVRRRHLSRAGSLSHRAPSRVLEDERGLGPIAIAWR